MARAGPRAADRRPGHGPPRGMEEHGRARLSDDGAAGAACRGLGDAFQMGGSHGSLLVQCSADGRAPTSGGGSHSHPVSTPVRPGGVPAFVTHASRAYRHHAAIHCASGCVHAHSLLFKSVFASPRPAPLTRKPELLATLVARVGAGHPAPPCTLSRGRGAIPPHPSPPLPIPPQVGIRRRQRWAPASSLSWPPS